MTDLQQPFWIHVKGVGFVLIAALSTLLLWWDRPEWNTLGLCALIAWSAARFYYYAFYVLEHYVDPSIRCRGLIDGCRWYGRRRRSSRGK